MMSLRELREGNPAHLSVFQTIPDGLVTELLIGSGFSSVLLDLQHGLAAISDLPDILRSAESAEGLTLVRVCENSFAQIGSALDRGADGVIVPLIETAAEAEAVVRAAEYPPRGDRSFGGPRLGLRNGGGYGGVRDEDDRPLIAVMIESIEAIRNLDEIVETPGVDALFVGPADLALSLGLPPSMDPEPGSEHERMIISVADRAIAAGKVAGIACAGAEVGRRWLKAGFTWLAMGGDFAYMAAAAKAAAHDVTSESPE